MKHTPPENVVVRVTGHEERSHSGTRLVQLLDKLPPIHTGHYHIRDHRIDERLRIERDGEGFDAAAGHVHCITTVPQDACGKATQVGVVLHDQNRFLGSRDFTPLAEPAFNMRDSLARVEGDRSLMVELARVFRGEIPGALAEIRHCVATGDSAGLERAAHGFKGACGNFGAGGAVRAAHALEHMGYLASREDVDARVADLERETLTLEEALLSVNEDTLV